MIMETKRIILSVYALLTGALWVNAQESTHWQYNIYDYQYDMSIYFKLQKGEKDITDISDYEVAAFVGDECRGVAEIRTATAADNSTVEFGYLRIRSNQVEGESVSFRAYQSSTGKTLFGTNTMSFKNMDMIGMPSAPYTLTLSAKKGDANVDGIVNTYDIVEVVNYMMGKPSDQFEKDAADINEDGSVNTADIVMIVNDIISN